MPRPHPHLAIPPPSSQSSTVLTDPWNFYVTPPESRAATNDPQWIDQGRYPTFVSSPPPSSGKPIQKPFSSTGVTTTTTNLDLNSDRPPSRASSDSGSTRRIPFPEPQIYRSSSQSVPRPASSIGSNTIIGSGSSRPSFNQTHRNTKSEVLLSPTPVTAHPDSIASSVTAYSDESSPEVWSFLYLFVQCAYFTYDL